jgi:GDP-mannose 6-dehydrogenase
MVKYTSNAWHALKICFANEIGNVCKAVGVDSHDVMDIFCQDDKLNISKAYMKPGFAFGGSCLPKDVRALEYRAKELDLDLPLLQAVLPSNRRQIQHALDRIVESGCKKIGLLGLSFKAGTDDLRESPLVILAEALLGKGYELRIYDSNILMGRLIGANRAYIEEQIPHIARLMCDSVDQVVAESDLLVLGNGSPDFADALARTREDQVVVDLVRTRGPVADIKADYQGLCW